MKSTQEDAREFGLHVKQGGWRLGLLVARNVQKGAGGGGTHADRNDRYGQGKVSAQEFARLSGTSAPRVLRYLDAWERAAEDGHVPLEPDQEIELDSDQLPAWGDYYDASASGGRPRASAGEVGNGFDKPEFRRRVLDSMTAEQKASLVVEAVQDEPEVVEQVMSRPTVRKQFEDEEDRAAKQRAKNLREAALQRKQPTPLSQFFWSLVGKLSEWTRDMKLIREEAGSLMPEQRGEVTSRLTLLRDEAQRCIDVIEGLGHEDDDVIEGDVSVRELTA